MKYCLSTFLILSACFIYAQIAPSPDAMGVVTAGAQQDLYRGFITETVPLYSVKADNGYQVPIQLTYQTRGIKVNDIASSVGLGWNLAAGGAITRVMRDEPDDQSTFVSDPNGFTVRKSEYEEKKGYDYEKDVFYYSYPGGGGTFISSREALFVSGGTYAEFHGLPYTDSQIEFNYTDANNSSWKLTDTQGVQYIFGVSTAAREVTKSSNYEEGKAPKENADFTYISTWYLEEIIFPNLPADQSIRFFYSKGQNLTTLTNSLSRDYRLGIFRRDIIGDPPREVIIYSEPSSHSSEKSYISKVEIIPSMLESTYSNKSKVDFVYSPRIDNPVLKRISGVSVKDNTNKTVLEYDLDYEYFDAADIGESCTSSSVCKRLKLKSIKKNGAILRGFHYMNEKDPLFSLPSKTSIKKDKFGYFNSNVESLFERYKFAQFPRGHPYSGSFSDILIIGPRYNHRNPSLDAQANSLWKIVYPTGGIKELEYDLKKSGGIVIKSVKIFEGEKIVGHTSYKYDEAIVIHNDLHAISAARNEREGPNVTLFSDSPYLTFDFMNVGGYEEAIVKDEMSGLWSEYNFYPGSTTDHKNSKKYKWQLEGTVLTNLKEIWMKNAPLMSPGFDPYVGLPKLVTNYDLNDEIISQNEFSYRYEVEDGQIAEHSFVRLRGSVAQYNVGVSSIPLGAFQMDMTTSLANEGDQSIRSQTSYTYHEYHKTLPKTVESFRIDAEGNRLENTSWYDSKSVTYYPIESFAVIGDKYVGDPEVTNLMLSLNMIALPIAVESWVKPPSSEYGLSGAGIATYQKAFELIHPHKSYSTNFNSLQSSWDGESLTEEGISTYNEDGRLLSTSGRSGLTTSYMYDDIGYLTSQTVSGEGIDRTSSYTYKPLVGTSSMTNPDGRTMKYEYDQRNRLEIVRNHEDNILKRYQYHNISDNIDLNAVINVNWHVDGNYEDRNHQFFLDNINCPYGECTYTWNFGDGTAESTGTKANHNYRDAGYYHVKVTISNPEYREPLVITKTISIETIKYWSLTINGPSSHCIHDNNSSPLSFVARISDGISSCSPGGGYSYQWSYEYNGSGGYVPFGTGQPEEVWPQNTYVEGNHKIKVIVTDRCGRSLTTIKNFSLIASGANCSSGGGNGPN